MEEEADAIPTPEIETPRLLLRRYLAGMVTDEHVSWLNDPGTMRFSEQRHQHHTLESQHEYLNRFPIGSYVWLLTLKATGHGIGTITAHIDRPNLCANMGILIGDKVWRGQGLAKEAWQAVMKFLTEDQGITRIESGMMELNRPMVRLAVSCGMRYEGRSWGRFLLDGWPTSQVNYAWVKRGYGQ